MKQLKCYLMNTSMIKNALWAFLAVLLCGSATTFAQSPTDPAKGYNVFMEHNVTLINNETEGPLACGGDLTIAGSYQVATHDVGTFDVEGNKIALLIGGRVYYQSGSALQVNNNGYVKIGDHTGSTVWYHDPNNATPPIRITPTTDYNSSPIILLQANIQQLGGVSETNNPVFQGGLIDFAAAFQEMRNSSLSIAQCSDRINLTNPNGQPIATTNLPNQVKVNLQDGINYLNIKGADLNSVQQFTYNQQPSANKVLVINVDAPGTFTWDVWNQGGIAFNSCPYVLYNFYNTTRLKIEGGPAIEGTVFAPFADIEKTVNQSNIEGQVIGKSLIHNGGEMHYAIFAPHLTGCAPTAGVPPTADFNINQTSQCFKGNTFLFTNTSNTGTAVQPEAPLSYLWYFGDGTTSTQMNPTKEYTAPGNYLVKLVATNTYGSDTQMAQVTVKSPIAPIITQSTVGNPPQGITKQFVLENSSEFSNISWKITGPDTAGFGNISTIQYTFTQAGYYEISFAADNKNGCPQDTLLWLTIDGDSVGTGHDGGLESHSLGDAVSKRFLQRKIDNVPTVFNPLEGLLFQKYRASGGYQTQDADGVLHLIDMFPDHLLPGDNPRVTSPTDVLDYTIAAEVLSVDYLLAGKPKAVVLGIRTTDKVYNHTKASCDRLRGAEILRIKQVRIQGYAFLMQAIKQRNGNTEYAVSFAVGKNKGDDYYTLQSGWFVNQYRPAENMYNFQVWSSSPEYTLQLAGDILDKLKAAASVDALGEAALPKTYVAKVSRNDTDLILLLRSPDQGQQVVITMDENYSETNGYTQRYNPLTSGTEQTLHIKVGDAYEFDGLVKVNGDVQDAFYYADGNWGLDFDPDYTTVHRYTVSNDFDRVYREGEKPVHRNVQLNAHSEYDYLTLYKSLLPGTLPADYTDYKFVSFTAKGSGLLELGLIKSSIEKWDNQYKTTLNVRDTEQTYYVPFSAFRSAANNEGLNADDLSMLTFTFLPVKAKTNDLNLTIKDVKFTKTAPEGYEDLLTTMENEFILYPNPSPDGQVHCLLYSDEAAQATVTLSHMDGRTVAVFNVPLKEGKNELNFNFKALGSGVGVLNISSARKNYGTTKVVIAH